MTEMFVDGGSKLGIIFNFCRRDTKQAAIMGGSLVIFYEGSKDRLHRIKGRQAVNGIIKQVFDDCVAIAINRSQKKFSLPTIGVIKALRTEARDLAQITDRGRRIASRPELFHGEI